MGAGRSGRPGRRDRHRRRGRHVRCRASDPGRTGAAGEHREGGEGEALGHGLPGRDPDLSGATGRLAVLRDQPGPRDLHQAARERATRSAAATCSIGWTTTRCCCCAARSRPTATCDTGDAGQDVRQLNRNLHVLGCRRRLHRQDGEGAQGAPARQGRSRDRSACPRRRGLPARAGADRQGDRRARRIRPAGCAGPARHLRQAAGAGGPRCVAAG